MNTDATFPHKVAASPIPQRVRTVDTKTEWTLSQAQETVSTLANKRVWSPRQQAAEGKPQPRRPTHKRGEAWDAVLPLVMVTQRTRQKRELPPLRNETTASHHCTPTERSRVKRRHQQVLAGTERRGLVRRLREGKTVQTLWRRGRQMMDPLTIQSSRHAPWYLPNK